MSDSQKGLFNLKNIAKNVLLENIGVFVETKANK